MLTLISRSRCLGKLSQPSKCLRAISARANSEETTDTVKKQILEYRHVYPEFLPDPNPDFRNSLREKLERKDMVARRTQIDIPEFYVAQGCRKISSFFTKQTPSGNSTKPKEIITIEDDDDDAEEESESLLNPKYSKRKLGVSGITPPAKKASQPSTSGLTEASKISENPLKGPSTRGSTPVKIRSTISVKTPEKLLNSAALNRLENPKTPPKKKSPLKSPKNTPTKGKRTPKKLFDKSPSNISEFNVEVLRNFVKITPTKKETQDNQAQLQNEKTPTKAGQTTPSTSFGTPAAKVKAKLDFEHFATKENIDTNNCSPNFDWDYEFDLDLTESQHCKIVNLNKKPFEIIITVESTQTGDQALCVLQDFWMHHNFSIGDTLHLKAVKQNDNWLIDNKNGFLVYEPDLLISTTAIVNSVFCKRRTVFSQKFRGFDPTNRFMIIGNMVHTLLQDVLRQKLYLIKDIKARASNILQGNEWTRQIYESGESLLIITAEFLAYVPKVHEFVETYIKRLKPHQKGNWQGAITGIEDIEENIWCPDLGVKGKVDVSVKNLKSVMPLEVKTGRATVSLEHRGQVLLYLMMMAKLNYPVSSGLLLYLKEGILKEIPPSDSEKRDLIILRNELAYYLLRVPNIEKSEAGTCVEPAELPAPIDHPCCSKCPYNAICMAYSTYRNEDLTEMKSLKKVHNDLSNYLTTTHIDYFMHWSSLLSIEMPQRGKTKDLRDIYTLPPRQRQLKGKCLINLTITNVIEEHTGVCVTTFEAESSSQTNFLLSGFIEGGYAIVSLSDRPAVATGFIQYISTDSVTVSLDRDLLKKHKGKAFFLDSYDSSTFLTYNLGSLALILDTSERANKFRSIIVDKQPATFQLKLPRALADKAKPILKRLNRVQQRAVLKAIAANEYFLIKGMPGTGKTATIVALIQILVATDKSVLITSHTHSAVDTVCLKLINYGVKFMRLGSEAKIDQSLKPYSEHNLIKHCTLPEELEDVYNSMQVIAVTCLGSGHALLSKRTMDVCIVDESTQVLQCSVFRPIFAAKTFILIGDPDQLPTVVRDKTCIELGMGESLFERLDSEESRISLNINYRMNSSITELANVLTYNGELEIGADRIANATLGIPNSAGFKEGWLIKALDTRLENAVQFIDTGPVWNLSKTVSWSQHSDESQPGENQKCINIYEAAIVYRLVRALIEGSVPSSHIGVIATYRVQVAILTELLKSTGVDVNTVDQFQGKDDEVIVYSCSKSKDLSQKWVENKFDITEDKRRLNVAITRAKHKLIIVGDLATLQNYSTFKQIKEVLERNVIRLTEFEDFDWDSVLDLDI